MPTSSLTRNISPNTQNSTTHPFDTFCHHTIPLHNPHSHVAKLLTQTYLDAFAQSRFATCHISISISGIPHYASKTKYAFLHFHHFSLLPNTNGHSRRERCTPNRPSPQIGQKSKKAMSQKWINSAGRRAAPRIPSEMKRKLPPAGLCKKGRRRDEG